jgi:hypothetical protein
MPPTASCSVCADAQPLPSRPNTNVAPACADRDLLKMRQEDFDSIPSNIVAQVYSGSLMAFLGGWHNEPQVHVPADADFWLPLLASRCIHPVRELESRGSGAASAVSTCMVLLGTPWFLHPLHVQECEHGSPQERLHVVEHQNQGFCRAGVPSSAKEAVAQHGLAVACALPLDPLQLLLCRCAGFDPTAGPCKGVQPRVDSWHARGGGWADAS